ncbi:MAG: 16S rRNA (cytosine(1402)-N(4))-methyltransferase RsmH [Oscillospiraceae bacterium]|nr:16S rRNA (cytosine(1402)-N(4))-methyltransferase RsmH [Oscillospiraceae bacterium]
MEIQFNHYPVMKTEAIEYLNIQPDGIYADFTLGGGSHAEEIAKRLDRGKLIAFDLDIDAIEFSKKKLKDYGDKIFFINDNFASIKKVANELGYEKIDGALADLGLSTHQIESDRGFSYSSAKESPLLMTMNQNEKQTAATVVNTFDKDRLKEILYKYGDEKFSGIIASAIVRERAKKPIETNLELTNIIKNAISNFRYEGGHPAKRSFQAFRAFCNREMENLRLAIDSAEQILKKGARIVVISFQSKEDEIVKERFGYYAKNCICPSSFPVCVCTKRATAKIVTKKPLYPSEAEIKENPASKSAKMRVLEKL